MSATSLDERVYAPEEEIRQLNDTIKDHLSTIETANKEINELLDVIDQKEAEIDALNKKYDELAKIHGKCPTELEEQVNIVKQQYQTEHQQHKITQDKLDALQHEFAALKQANTTLTEAISASDKAIADAEQQLQQHKEAEKLKDVVDEKKLDEEKPREEKSDECTTHRMIIIGLTIFCAILSSLLVTRGESN
eukprot:UN04823